MTKDNNYDFENVLIMVKLSISLKDKGERKYDSGILITYI